MNIIKGINNQFFEYSYRCFSSPDRKLPDFIIIGAMKSGTTSLYNYLIQHPRIIAAQKKEVHFFDKHFHIEIIVCFVIFFQQN